MKKLLPYMKKYMGYAVLSPILMILEVVADIIIPYLMSLIVDVGIKNQDIDYIVKIGLLMVASAILAMVFGIVSAHFGARAGSDLLRKLGGSLYKDSDFSFANLDQFTTSSLITRLTNDCNTIGQVTMMSLRMAIRAPFMMLLPS